MDLYNLGYVSWWESQCYYHALAHLGREGLIICAPDSPYVCLGLHDDLNQEIDLGFCKDINLPLFRREVGGGVVYLDNRQIFFQLVFNQDNENIPFRRDHYYATFLKAPIKTYHALGVPAEYKYPADLIANGAKCSGNAAGDIGLGIAFVGNILLDFDYKIMAQVLRSPHPNFRHYLEEAMSFNMTTVDDWNSEFLSYQQVANLLINEYSKILGELNHKEIDEQLREKALNLRDKLTSTKWLSKPGRTTAKRKVKINEGLYLHEGINKSNPFAALVRDNIIEEFYILNSNHSGIEREASNFEGLEWSDDFWEEIIS